MLEEPTRSGELVTAPPDLTPSRAKTGRPHPQELRSRVITAVLGGASSRQAAARYGERQRGVRDASAKQGASLRGSPFTAEGRAPVAAAACRRSPPISSWNCTKSLVHAVSDRLSHPAKVPQEGPFEVRRERAARGGGTALKHVGIVAAVIVVTTSSAVDSKTQTQHSPKASSYDRGWRS
jgi:hypothetical protein